MTRISTLIALGAAGLMALAAPAAAQSFTLDLGDGGTTTGRIVQLIALITVLSLAPSILVMVTTFTRIVVVLSFLRTAIGLQSTPPNAVLISLALFLTAFIMAPTLRDRLSRGHRAADARTGPPRPRRFERTVKPLHAFMLGHVRDQDLELFFDLAKLPEIETREQTPLRVLVPAFMISELRRAFEIGFLLFVPFLIIDMVVASMLMSMGMMMLPPVVISLPFKLIFFVLVDGWYLVAGSLVQSFGPS